MSVGIIVRLSYRPEKRLACVLDASIRSQVLQRYYIIIAFVLGSFNKTCLTFNIDLVFS